MSVVYTCCLSSSSSKDWEISPFSLCSSPFYIRNMLSLALRKMLFAVYRAQLGELKMVEPILMPELTSELMVRGLLSAHI